MRSPHETTKEFLVLKNYTTLREENTEDYHSGGRGVKDVFTQYLKLRSRGKLSPNIMDSNICQVTLPH